MPDAAAAALIETAPTETDVKEGAVAAELIAAPETPAPREVSPLPEDGSVVGGVRSSPIVEMLSKRLKATGKKIVRPCLV